MYFDRDKDGDIGFDVPARGLGRGRKNDRQQRTGKKRRGTTAAAATGMPSVLSAVLGASHPPPPTSAHVRKPRRLVDDEDSGDGDEQVAASLPPPAKRPRSDARDDTTRPSSVSSIRINNGFFRRFPSFVATTTTTLDGDDGDDNDEDPGAGTDAEKASMTQRIAERAQKIREAEQTRRDAIRGRLDELVASTSSASRASVDIGSAPAVVDDEPEEPEYKPVLHPRLLEVENRLGPHQPEDEYCYIRDVVMEMNQSSLPKEVSELLATIRQCNYGTQDKVDAALRIKAQYDVTIYGPANRKLRPGESSAIKEWTVRSIFNYLTRQDNSSGAILEDVMSKLHRAVTAIDRNMYRAPVSKIRKNAVQEQDLRIEKSDLQNMLNAASKLLSVVTMRERLRQTDDGGGGGITSSSSSIRRSKAGGDGGGGTGGTARSKNKSVSALMGRASTGTTGFLENEIGRTKDRPY